MSDEIKKLLAEREQFIEYRDSSDDTLEYREYQHHIDQVNHELEVRGFTGCLI